MDIAEALDAASGVTCFVGAGGKKTSIYALADRLDRAVVTATVRIPIFDPRVASVVVTDDPVGAVREADDWPLGVVAAREREDRYRGYDTDVVDALGAAGVADAVLVKADGARTRWLKAPNDREPQVPAGADTVVPVASTRVIGEPLSEERVHRPERVGAIAGLEPGEEIRPDDVAAVLSSERGGLKGVPDGATAVPLVNMVDDADRRAVGEETARGVLARTADAPVDVPRVVLARMIDDEPLVAVVE